MGGVFLRRVGIEVPFWHLKLIPLAQGLIYLGTLLLHAWRFDLNPRKQCEDFD